MKLRNLLLMVFVFAIYSNTFAQPSESQLRAQINKYYGDVSFINDVKYESPKYEKRWVKDRWKYYWSRKFIIRGKTDYSGIYQIIYGAVQYEKNGGSYNFNRILTGGVSGYEGIPNPDVSAMNAHLKASFDPLTFYNNYKMNYLIDAPNDVVLADNPNWKWIGLNTVICDVVSKYTVLSNDIGGVQEKQGTFRVTLKRSEDGINFNKDAKLLKNGKWLPAEKGSESNVKVLKSYNITKDELKNTRTFAQQYAEKHAEEFKKSLAVVQMPDFKNANHLMQFTHELMIEGDEAKITAFCYQMFPKYLFEEWSEIVLNQNGKEKLEGILADIDKYQLAFCKHPIIKEIGEGYVRFYDRNKKRMNNIRVSYENNRWYVSEMKYFIRDEDIEGFKQNQEDNCGENPIYLDQEPAFVPGQKVEIFHGGSWREAEILKSEMHKGGYSVKYGVSGLTEWKYVSEVRASTQSAEEEAVQAFKEFEIGQKVKAKYTNVWYEGTILKVSYENEAYLVDIPQRNIETWVHNQDITEASAPNKQESSAKETEKSDKKKDKKSKLSGLKNKINVKL